MRKVVFSVFVFLLILNLASFEIRANESNLELEIVDINQNHVAAKMAILKDGKIISSKKGVNASFNLAAGKYQLNVSKEGYEPIEEAVIIDKKNIEKKVILSSKFILQKRLKLDGESFFTIKGLKDSEEAIIAITPLNLRKEVEKSFQFNLKTVYYNYFGQRLDIDINDSTTQQLNLKEINLENKLRAKEQESAVKGAKIKAGKNKGQKYNFYQSKEFYVPKLIAPTDEKKSIVKAKMIGQGEYITIFVDERYDLPLEKVDDLAREFDTNIYPTLTKKIGQASDVDNNGKLMVLLTKFSNYKTSGLFYGADLQKNIAGTNFNDLVYLNLDKGHGKNLYPSLAHQFSHLIFYNQKLKNGRKSEDTWVNEGIAQLSQKLCGYIDYGKEAWSWHGGNNWLYSTDKNYPGYFLIPEAIAPVGKSLSIPYLGASSLFMNYLVEQYGDDILIDLVRSTKASIEVIEEKGSLSFEKLFLNWITTNIADKTDEINSKVYNYQSFDLAKEPKMLEIDSDLETSFKVKGAGVKYIKLYGQNSDIQLSLTGKDKEVGIVIIRRKVK